MPGPSLHRALRCACSILLVRSRRGPALGQPWYGPVASEYRAGAGPCQRYWNGFRQPTHCRSAGRMPLAARGWHAGGPRLEGGGQDLGARVVATHEPADEQLGRRPAQADRIARDGCDGRLVQVAQGHVVTGHQRDIPGDLEVQLAKHPQTADEQLVATRDDGRRSGIGAERPGVRRPRRDRSRTSRAGTSPRPVPAVAR